MRASPMKRLLVAGLVTALSASAGHAEFSGDARAVAEQQAKIDQSQWVLQPLKDEARSACRDYVALNTQRWQMQHLGAGTNGAASGQPALYREFMQLQQRENAASQRCFSLQGRAGQCIIAFQQAVTAKQNVADAMRRAERANPGSCLVPE